MERKVLLGLTTTSKSDWREKIREINKLGIKEIALFPTFLNLPDRKELYNLLEKTGLQKIPHVHLRDDAEEWELDYLSEKYGTKLFNIHAFPQALQILEIKKHRKNIFLENQEEISELYINSLERSGGICLDVSHWEDMGIRMKRKGYDQFLNLIKKYKIGCSHVSIVNDIPEKGLNYITGEGVVSYSHHWLNDLSELDYVKKHAGYLPEYVSIELENPFSEQLKVREYLENMINNKKNE
jgi:sugar phosphate isomerase/epimerase